MLPDWGDQEHLAAALVARSAGTYPRWGEVVELTACTAARIGETSGMTIDQVLRHYQHADGGRSAPVVATGCRCCRHRCRQLPPGHPLASRSGPGRGPSPYHLEAGRSSKVVYPVQAVGANRTSSAGVGAVAALWCCTAPCSRVWRGPVRGSRGTSTASGAAVAVLIVESGLSAGE
jgi:hypothetical protein